MKKTLLVSSLSLMLLSFNSIAQNWVTTGNALSANGTLGSTTNFSILFKSNGSERGRLTNSGLWGFGTSSPNSKVHINSPSGQIPLRVQVNASTKFLVNSSGNIGIGTTSPQEKFHVNGTGNLARFGTGTTSSTNNYWYTGNDIGSYIEQRGNTTTAGSDRLRIQSSKSGNFMDYAQFNIDPNNGFSFVSINGGNGNVAIEGRLAIGATTTSSDQLNVVEVEGGGINLSNPYTGSDWEFYVYQNLALYYEHQYKGNFDWQTGQYFAVSDERLKTNIKPMGPVLQKINQLKPSTYQFRNAANTQEYNGFIAQDVMKIFPTIVNHNVINKQDVDVYTMNYSEFGVLAIKGIQELEQIIEDQKKVNDQQRQEIEASKERINKLEAALVTITANNSGNISIITNASLEQNNPNPFTKSTIIRYSIPQGSKGQINIYDQASRLVKTLNANAGGQSQVSGHDLVAGAYTYTLMIDGKVSLSKQMLIIK